MDTFHYQDMLGLGKAKTLVLDSPFATTKTVHFMCAKKFTRTSDPLMLERVVEVAQELIMAARGRCFLLFTSHYMLNRVADALAQRVANPLLTRAGVPPNKLY